MFRSHLRKLGVTLSYSHPGMPLDNAVAESFFACMKREELSHNYYNRWQELLDNGDFESPEALAEALGVHASYVRRFLRLALLAPPIVDAVFTGNVPWTLSLTKLNTTLPYSWKEQMELFGIA